VHPYRSPAALIAIIVLAVSPSVPLAQDKLPAKMSGTYNGTTPGRGTPFGGNWSVVIDKQEADGSVTGRATWEGRQCVMDGEPFTGRLEGTELTIIAQFRDKMPNAQCPKARLVLKKGSGNDFEGTIPGSPLNYRLTLRPS
jgi:hypothetical protein